MGLFAIFQPHSEVCCSSLRCVDDGESKCEKTQSSWWSRARAAEQGLDEGAGSVTRWQHSHMAWPPSHEGSKWSHHKEAGAGEKQTCRNADDCWKTERRWDGRGWELLGGVDVFVFREKHIGNRQTRQKCRSKSVNTLNTENHKGLRLFRQFPTTRTHVIQLIWSVWGFFLCDW